MKRSPWRNNDSPFLSGVRHLPEGLHNRPLASRYGWHLVWIERRVEGQVQPFERVIDRVRHTLREQATRRALRHYLLCVGQTLLKTLSECSFSPM